MRALCALLLVASVRPAAAHNPMCNVRVVVDAAVRASRHIEVLAPRRTDGVSHDAQTGRVPTPFGRSGRSGYGDLTSLRRDALPFRVTDVDGRPGAATALDLVVP